MSKKWTIEDVEKHAEINTKDYGAAVIIAALFHKLYGRLPKLGLSGFQAEGAFALSEVFPECTNNVVQD